MTMLRQCPKITRCQKTACDNCPSRCWHCTNTSNTVYGSLFLIFEGTETAGWHWQKCVDLRWWCTFRDVITLNYHRDIPGGRQLVWFWWILVKELNPMIRHTSFYRKIGAWYLDYLRLLTHVAGVIMYDSTGWWFGTFFIFPYIGNVIIPTDFHIFQRGRLNRQPAVWVNLGMDPAEERATALTAMIQQELQKRISLEEELKACQRGVRSKILRTKRRWPFPFRTSGHFFLWHSFVFCWRAGGSTPMIGGWLGPLFLFGQALEEKKQSEQQTLAIVAIDGPPKHNHFCRRNFRNQHFLTCLEGWLVANTSDMFLYW